MNEKRFRISVSLIAMLFLLAVARVLANTNPILDTIEPLTTQLDEFSGDIALIKVEEAEDTALQASQVALLQEENQRLRDELSLRQERDSVTAEITRRDLTGFTKTVWIDVGRQDGIRVGQTVLRQGNLFGLISEVFDSTARVRTVVDPNFRSTVTVGDQHGILKVDHGSLIADLVPSKTLDGQAVVTDGLDGEVLANVMVGVAETNVSDEADVFGAYNVLLPYNLYDVRFIEVVTSGAEQ